MPLIICYQLINSSTDWSWKLNSVKTRKTTQISGQGAGAFSAPKRLQASFIANATILPAIFILINPKKYLVAGAIETKGYFFV